MGAYSYLLAKSLLSIRPMDANPIHKHDIRAEGIGGAEELQPHQYFKITVVKTGCSPIKIQEMLFPLNV